MNLPNILTLFRALLALVFLIDSPTLRGLAVLAAAISDGLDGYLARRWQQETPLGKALDPIVDKFFVFFAISTLLREHRLGSYELIAVATRDIVLLLFGIYIGLSGQWKYLHVSSSNVGKIVTACQFLLLLALCFSWPLPSMTYSLFALLGGCILVELFIRQKDFIKP